MAERLIGGVDYPRTVLEFQEWFATDAACLDFLARLRWPDGFVCPKCGVSEQAWRIAGGLWMCRACGRQTSVTAGTIFDRTRSPLRMWFHAAWYITSQKTGVSAQGLQRVLGLRSYETAWTWMHKFRRAMVVPGRELLHGIVELDETYVGGISRGNAGRSSMKVGVMVATEMLGGKRLGRIRLEPSPGESLQLISFAQRVIQPGAMVRTDGARELKRLANLGYEHERHVELGSDVPAHVSLYGVHTVASLLKRWLEGTLHQGISNDHLSYYLDEFTFRFNRRASRSRGLLFYRLLDQAMRTDPAPLPTLVAAKEQDDTNLT
ncbi:IS1595 family transposase [Microbacterium sp. SD291]|uniref:IS1595 family transposase n=1 Tax=Microbacterium sp. SD291 TaxID=2782007 RepID=UPI001A97CEEA|nr:IS1595 family transposase [Microbacterium sp. SD291]MBO0979060.1 IS1595 family transposase [Microbacterium sp. SD291]